MTAAFELYERVRVVTNRFKNEGVPAGTVAFIVERYEDDALEIEVSNPESGETTAMIVARPEDLEHAPSD